MKRFYSTIVGLGLAIASLALAPQGFNFQTVIRNPQGDPLQNQNISIRLSITNQNGNTTHYSESHSLSTNLFGVVSLIVGDGATDSGSFQDIPWADGNKYLKIEVDPSAGTDFQEIGVSKLMSVPYALYALNGAEGPQGEPGADGQDGVGIASIAHNTDGTLTFTLTDDSSFTTDDITGPAGESGSDGLSAYELWLNEGMSGTIGDFLESLKGEKGNTGEEGIGLLFQWDGTQLGIRRTSEPEFNYVDLAGTDGRTILSGEGSPSPSHGNDDDFYLNTSNSTLFGPKAQGDWGTGVSLVGQTGQPGPEGRSVLNGDADPIAQGQEGDFYINTASYQIFGPKTSDGWSAGTSLIGPSGQQGSDGKTILNGEGTPSAGIGIVGDFYIDTQNKRIYGPKTAGGWGTSTSIVGPAGTGLENRGTWSSDTVYEPGDYVFASSSDNAAINSMWIVQASGAFTSSTEPSEDTSNWVEFQAPQGEQGPKGDPGDTGDPGISLNWRGTFSSNPSSPMINDAYYNTTQGISYIYNGTSWQQMTQDGRTILSGSGAPASGIGLNGDFYIDTDGDMIYGPKSGGSWGDGTSLVGPLVAGSSGQTLRHDGDTWVASSVLTNNGTNLGVGTSSPVAKLDVAGNIAIRTGAGAGKLLTSNAEGIASWQDPSNHNHDGVYATVAHTHSAEDINSGTLNLDRIPNLPASKISSGIFPVERGGTGISSYSAGDYIYATGPATIGQRSPAEVLDNIGAAPLIHDHDGVYAPVSHSHGNLTSDGRIGSTADRLVITGTGGVLSTLPAGQTNQFLRGDGSWETPENTTYSAGNGIELAGTELSVVAGIGLSQESNGLSLTNPTIGQTTQGALWYNGTTQTAGKFYGGTSNPTNATRLNYSGNFYATRLYGWEVYDTGQRVFSPNNNNIGTGSTNYAAGDHTHEDMVTGTGDENYLTRWATSSTIGSSTVFDDGNNVGIGTFAPTEKLEVAGSIKAQGLIVKDSTDEEELLFAVRNSNNEIVFAVYETGVRINVGKLDENPKSTRGGFAIGGLTEVGTGKADGEEYLLVTRDGTMVRFDDTPTPNKSSRSGFAIGGLTEVGTGKAIENEYFQVSRIGTMVRFDEDASKSTRSGFAIGGLTEVGTGKSEVPDFLHVTRTGTSINFEVDNTSGKTNDPPTREKDNFIKESNQGDLATHNSITKSSKSTRSGFAIGGLTDINKAGTIENFFNISSDEVETISDEARILWYPIKEAFLAGRILIESPDSVGTNSWASGYESKSIGDFSQALGYKARAFGDGSTAIGRLANANAQYSFALGENAKALGIGSYAIGSFGLDTISSIPSGNPAVASGDYSFAIGLGSESSKLASFAIGTNVLASGNYSMAIGIDAVASGTRSFAIGSRVEASGFGSYAFGPDTKALTANSFAIGVKATADSGDEWYPAFAFGNNLTASNVYAMAFGNRTTSSGFGSLAMGELTNATGQNSSAFGYNTTSSGRVSTTFGFWSQASGERSFAAGTYANASGDYSTALGDRTTAPSGYEMVVGRYNLLYSPNSTTSWNSGDRLFVIGNGTGTGSLRSNAFTVLKNGNIGVNTPTPTTRFHVEHPNSGGNGLSISNVNNASYRWSLYVSSSNEALRFYYDGDLRSSINATTGAYSTHSDKRLKENINKAEPYLNKVNQLKVVEYNFKGQKDEIKHIGLIAQDVEKFFPSIVTKPTNTEEGETFYSLNYSATGVIAIKAIQEQQEIITEQSMIIQQLKREIDNLNEQLILFDELNQRIMQLEKKITNR